jgi:hypothetical protein
MIGDWHSSDSITTKKTLPNPIPIFALKDHVHVQNVLQSRQMKMGRGEAFAMCSLRVKNC